MMSRSRDPKAEPGQAPRWEAAWQAQGRKAGTRLEGTLLPRHLLGHLGVPSVWKERHPRFSPWTHVPQTLTKPAGPPSKIARSSFLPVPTAFAAWPHSSSPPEVGLAPLPEPGRPVTYFWPAGCNKSDNVPILWLCSCVFYIPRYKPRYSSHLVFWQRGKERWPSHGSRLCLDTLDVEGIVSAPSPLANECHVAKLHINKQESAPSYK